MSKKRKYYIEYNRVVNGTEYSKVEYTVEGVTNESEARQKLNRICEKAGGPEPIITLIREVR